MSFCIFLVYFTLSLSAWKPPSWTTVLDNQTRGPTTSTLDAIFGETRGRQSVFRFRGRGGAANRSFAARILFSTESNVRSWNYVHVTLSAATWASWLFHQHAGRKEEEEPDIHRSRDGSAEARGLVHSQHSSQSRGKFNDTYC